jgi:predicted PurR-regulated permease PerM
MRREPMSWTVRDGARAATGAGLVLLGTAIAVIAREVLVLVFLAIVLGAALEPVVAWIRARTGLARGPGILIVYAAFLAAVAVVAVLIVPAALVQLSAAIARLPNFLEQVRTWSAGLRPPSLAAGIGGLIDLAEGALRPGPPPDPSSVVSVSLVVGSIGAGLVTLLALVFFWLIERPRLQRYALAFLPADRRRGVHDAWNAVESRLGMWARGQLILMAAIGLAAGAAYSLLGLPAPLLLALVAALVEVIPIAGPLIGAIPAVLLATSISVETALLTVLVYAVIQGLEGNVLVPLVMRNSVGVPPFVVLASLLVGWAVGGVIGAVVAVPLVAAVTVILERLQDRDVPVLIEPATDHEASVPVDATSALPPDAPGRVEAHPPVWRA